MNYEKPIILAAMLSGVSMGAFAQKSKEHKPLNIIHIMTDDHSYQTISAYGSAVSRLAPTPNIDRLAAEGVLFRSAYVENSLSTPSRACLMTGLYSHQNGQRTLGKGIDTSKVFVSEILHENGYQTAVVGKWHMQCEPKGFDYYEVLDGQGSYYNPSFKSKNSKGAYIQEEGYATKLITDHAIEFLEKRDKTKPFSLFVHHKAPHRNWMPEGKYLDLYEDVEFPLPETFYDDYSTRGVAAHTQEMSIDKNLTMNYDLKVDSTGEWKSIYESFTPEQNKLWQESYGPRNKKFLDQKLTGDSLLRWKYQRYIKDYLRCIKTVDDEVGRLIAYLEKNDLLDNTIIVYTSDQGFYMGEHGWFDKRFMYEESFRTPLIVRYPHAKNKGTVNTDLVQNIDYAPTYLDIAGVKKPESFVGSSLVPLIKGQNPENWREYLYYHYYDYPAVHQVRRQDGVRDKRYKLIHFYGEGVGKEKGIYLNENELYDLKTDSNELHNLYGKAEYKEITDRLQARLDQFRKEQNVDEW